MIRFPRTSEIGRFRCNTSKKELLAIWLMVIGFLLAKFEFRVVFGDRRVDKIIPAYLGILFTDNLKWSDHINNITKKANSTLGFLCRNLGRYPTECKKNAYISLVRSSLEYGSILWDPYTQKDIDKLERVQRSAARFITGDYKSRTPGSVQKLLNKLDFETLQERRKQLRLVYFYKIVEGLVPAIPCTNFLEQQKTGRQIRSTRSSDFLTQNPIQNYVRNNNKCFKTQPCNTEQKRIL